MNLFKLIRIVLLLSLLFVIVVSTWMTEQRMAAWERPILVTIFPIVADDEAATLAFARDVELPMVTIGFGVVGFIDDYFKVSRERNLGLGKAAKFGGQLAIAGGFAWWAVEAGVTTGIGSPCAEMPRMSCMRRRFPRCWRPGFASPGPSRHWR